MNVVVTGGSRGIGAGIVEKFAHNGYNVVINYNNSEEAAIELMDRLNGLGCSTKVCRANVSSKREVTKLMDFCRQEYGRVDVLVNNAGIARARLFDEITEQEWTEVMDVNLRGVFNCSQAVVEEMIHNKSGSIVNVSSIWGISGASMEVHYSAAKAGVIGLTKALAKELGPSNIRVNCVLPGVIKTDMLKGYRDEDLDALREDTLLRRLGTPSDVANAVYFLASSEASFVTGEVLNVSGGFLV